MNLMSLIIWATVQFVIVCAIIMIFEKLRKKLQQKYLRYVGIAAALFFCWMQLDSMVKLQSQIFLLRDAAADYQDRIGTDMDGSMIEAIKNHNSKVEKLQSKVNEHPVIYWIMSGDTGDYESLIVDLPKGEI